MFDRGVVHIVVEVYIVNQYCMRFDREVVHIVAEVYIVNQYCVRFDMNYSSVKQ
jgi:hypothetical protein